MPQTALQLLKEINKPGSSARDLAAILRRDQALSARVLKVANSAFYGLPRQVASIDSAVVLLGNKTIRNLALTASLTGMKVGEVTGYGLPRGELFNHSLLVALAAQELSKQTNRAIPEEAYTVGLLHDIGKLIIDEQVEAKLAEISEIARNEGIGFAAAEKKLLGMDHGEVGAILAEHWGLPELLTVAIKDHHVGPSGNRPQDTTSLTAVTMVANRVGRELGSGVGANETLGPGISGEILEVLGLKQEDMEELQVEVRRNIIVVGDLTGTRTRASGGAGD